MRCRAFFKVCRQAYIIPSVYFDAGSEHNAWVHDLEDFANDIDTIPGPPDGHEVGEYNSMFFVTLSEFCGQSRRLSASIRQHSR